MYILNKYTCRGMRFEWDWRKAEANFHKHGVRGSECHPVFDDDYAITVDDDSSDPQELRFVSVKGPQLTGTHFGCCLQLSLQQYPHHLGAFCAAARTSGI